MAALARTSSSVCVWGGGGGGGGSPVPSESTLATGWRLDAILIVTA